MSTKVKITLLVFTTAVFLSQTSNAMLEHKGLFDYRSTSFKKIVQYDPPEPPEEPYVPEEEPYLPEEDPYLPEQPYVPEEEPYLPEEEPGLPEQPFGEEQEDW